MKTLVSIKIDKNIKAKAQEVAQELGLSLSTLINVQLRDLVRTRSISISAAPRMSPRLEKMARQAEEDYHNRINISPAFDDIKKAIAYLHSK